MKTFSHREHREHRGGEIAGTEGKERRKPMAFHHCLSFSVVSVTSVAKPLLLLGRGF
jgi:hypothetical protein